MASDGSGRQPVAATIPGDQFLPVWSPDGSQIAFRHHSPPAENGDIAIELAIVDLATSSWRAVATAYVIHQNDLGFPLMLWPDWSPDGKWLAFARGSDAATGSELAVVRPSGDQLINYRIDSGFIMVPPAWSPDGRYLAYGTGGTSSELIVRDFLTDKVVQTASIPANQIGELVWSADGAELFFSTLGSSTGDILKMSVATGEISQVTDWIGREYMMDLSPDGSRLAVVFVPPVDTRPDAGEEVVSQLIVMNVDGTERQVLATDVGVGASWRPSR
jgi:Tol biopolymer transport system component